MIGIKPLGASERLAEDLHADYLIILTAVEKVAIHFGQPDATVVNLLIDVVFLPDLIRDREFSQPLLDAHLGLHVAQVVALEGVPFVRCVEGAVPGALAIGLRRRTGLAEEFDQLLAFGQFLLFQPQHGTDTLQGERLSH